MTNADPAGEGPELDRWLTVADVAALQQVHRKTVLRWIAERRLPAQRIGRHYRISLEQMHRALDAD